MERDFGLGRLNLNNPADIPPSQPTRSSRVSSTTVTQDFDAAKRNSGVLTILGKKIKANLDDLQFIEDIGNGSCGTVTKCSYESSIIAVKTMPLSRDTYELSRILMDLHVVSRSINFPYIVRCYGYFITSNDVRVCMECMATCLDRLLLRTGQPIPEKVIANMTYSIVLALNYLKTEHKIMHRDVKPSNILLDWSGVIKLCDFGIAGKLIESRAHSKQAGCPLYMGPERLDPDNNEPYDIRSDVWSLGLTLVELATGKYPFAGNEFEMISKILNEEPPRLDPGKFSFDFCDFVECCLQRDPKKRPHYNRLLQHAFINSVKDDDPEVEEWFADVMS